MKIRIFLLFSLFFSVLCGSVPVLGVTVINEGVRLTHNAVTDIYNLTWQGKAEPVRFYSVLASDELLEWYFLPGSRTEGVDAMMGWNLQTNADRLFLKVETDQGVHLRAQCEAGARIRLDIDASFFASEIVWDFQDTLREHAV